MANFSSGFTSAYNARTQRESLRQAAKERNENLAIKGYTFEDGKMQVRPGSMAEAEQLQALEATQLAKSLQGKLSAQDTDKAFEDYSATGDASYLQRALENNPLLKSAWAKRGIQMISNINFDEDKDLLSRAGFKESTYDTEEKKNNLKRNMYKVYDGAKWVMRLANKAYQQTGAYKRLGERRSQQMEQNYEDFVSMMNGPMVSPNTAQGNKYEKEINGAAEKYNLPPDLLAAQIAQESSGRADAVSSAGATGLMQLMPATAEEMGVTDPTDPKQSIEGGAKYLRQMLDRYDGDLNKALAAYNAGPGNVDKYGGIPPFGETQKYVENIKNRVNQAGSYYGYNYDNVANTILEHRRAIANAEKGLTNEQVAQGFQQDQRKMDIAEREVAAKEEAARVKRETEGTTTVQKNLAAAEAETNDLINTFGGEEQFMQTDFSDPKAYRQAYQNIVKIERLEGTELSEADKKQITEIRQLIALGDPATKLSAADTGLIDSNLKEVKKYVSDNVEGTGAKSAYAAFRNSVRHALYGSALTESEIKSFNEAFGTLGQQAGPVLEMFETSLSQVQAKLDSTANLMNPYSAKVRLGADQEKLIKIKEALQARIDYLQGRLGQKERTPLDEIFKGE